LRSIVDSNEKSEKKILLSNALLVSINGIAQGICAIVDKCVHILEYKLLLRPIQQRHVPQLAVVKVNPFLKVMPFSAGYQ
jgi:hypothetical protein